MTMEIFGKRVYTRGNLGYQASRMKLLRRIGLSLAIVLLVAAGVLLWAGFRTPPPLLPPLKPFPPAAPVSGAAVFYNQAFAAMPKLGEEERKAMGKGGRLDLEASERQLVERAVERFGPALDLIARGTKEPSCEWGIDLNKGTSVKLPQLSPGLTCVQALGARVRLHLDAGEADAAMDDLLVGLRFSRDLGEPSLLICELVRFSCEHVLLNPASRNLLKFDAAALTRLEQGIAALPPISPVTDSIELKREMLPLTVYNCCNFLRKMDTQSPWFVRGWEHLIEWSSSTPESRMKWASSEQLDLWTQSLAADYEALFKTMRLPFAEAKPKIDAIRDGDKENPFARLILPNVVPSLEEEVQHQGYLSVFRAALDARLHHPGEERARIAAIQDQVTGKPVQCHDVPGGVEVAFPSAIWSVTRLKLTFGLETPER
jgi:hypothetical protein